MDRSVLRSIAAAGPWLAPVPSAYFIGRSIYLHLLVGWAGGAVPVPPAIDVAVAIIAGTCIELLAIVSIHNTLALRRWNDQPRVKREKGGWERAPLRLSEMCIVLYLLTAIMLLVVLETFPSCALYAPMMFPLLAIVGALNLVVFNQHLDRLARYDLDWDLSRKGSDHERPGSAVPSATSEIASAVSETASGLERIACDRCDWKRAVSDYEDAEAAQNALNAHIGWHTRKERANVEYEG